MGSEHVILWPAHDGYEYPFQMDYRAGWRHLVECYGEVVLNNGGKLLAINAFYLQIAIGLLILVAVAFDQMNTRRAARG